MAEELVLHASVVAIAQTGTKLAPLGFVRETCRDDEWRTEVDSRMARALAMVVVLG